MGSMSSIHIAAEILGSAFCLLEMLYIFVENRDRIMIKHFNRLYLDNIIILLFCSLSLLLDVFSKEFGSSSAGISLMLVKLSYVIYFILNYLLILIFTDYMIQYTQTDFELSLLGKRINWIRLVGGLTVIACINVVGSLHTGSVFYINEDNLFCQGPLYNISHFYGIFVFLVDIIFMYKNWKSKSADHKHGVVFYIAFPILAMLIQLFLYSFPWLYFIMLLVLLLILVNQQYLSERRIVEHNLVLARKEKELNEYQVKIAISQIQPHFLFNALNSIGYLCKKDPDIASEAVDRFSAYLRMNIDSLTKTKLIPFADELSHTKTYLWLEQMRFGDRVHVVYDIKEENFSIPALTLQPIVENAVKHGVCKKAGGGIIRISTQRRDDAIEIKVVDDGVGFDSCKGLVDETGEGHLHIGIANVNYRLHEMCGGYLTYYSKEGMGSEFCLMIPHKDARSDENEYTCAG